MNKNYLILILALIIGVGLWSWKNKSADQPVMQTAVTPQEPPVAAPTAKVVEPKKEANRAITQSSDAPDTLDLSQDPQAEKFVRDNALRLWQVDPNSLQFEKKDTGERVKVTYIQRFNGVPIFGARLSLFVEGDRLSRIQNALSQSSVIEGDFTLSGSQAERQLKDQNWQVQGLAEPLFYPLMQKLRPAYRVYATREGEAKDVIVDAADGRIIRTIPRTHY